MGAILKLSFAQIRKKKLQYLLLTIILMLSVILFTTAISVIKNTQGIYSNMHDYLNGAHQIIQIEENLHSEEEVHAFWEKQDGVMVSPVINYRRITTISTEDESQLLNYTALMVKTPLEPLLVDDIIASEGNMSKVPSNGCVWVPTSVVLANGWEIGDSLIFKDNGLSFSLKIEAIVVDISYCAPFSTDGRFFMNPEDYVKVWPDSSNDFALMSLRFDDYSENQSYWDRFEKDFGVPFMETIQDFESLSSFYYVTNNMIGFVMLFIGVVMFLIALFSIGYTVVDTVISDYKTIGITKSLGFSAKKTILSYLFQYSLICLIAVSPGINNAYAISKLIVKGTFKYLSTPLLMEQFKFFGTAFFVALIVPVIVLGIVYLFTRKATKIQPAQVIRYGTSENTLAKTAKSLSKLELFGRMKLEWALGIRAIFINRRSSIVISIISIISTAVLAFCAVFFWSFVRMQDTIVEWGYDNSDVVIVSKNDTKVDSSLMIETLNKIDAVSEYTLYGAKRGIVLGDGKHSSMGIVISVMDGGYDTIGYTTLTGRNPRNSNEIAIGVNLANRYGKSVGDSFIIYINGEVKTFLISGIYQAISNMAFSARLTADAIEGFDEYVAAFVNLKEGISGVEFAKEFNMIFEDKWTATASSDLLGSVINEAITVISIPVILIAVIFLIVIFIILYCMGCISTKKNQLVYGIYMSLGMTTKRIRKSITISTFIISFISMIFGIGIGTIILPKLLNLVLVNYGIVKTPLLFNVFIIVGISLLATVCATFGSYASSKSIGNASPKMLIVE